MPCFLSHLLYNFMCVWEFAMGSVFFGYFSMCLSLDILKFVDFSLNLFLRHSNTLSYCCLLAHRFSCGLWRCCFHSVFYWRSPWPSWFRLFNLILLYFSSGRTEDLLVAYSVLQFFNHGILCRLIFILGLVLADYFNLDIDVLSPVRYILKYFRFSLFVSFILFRS